MGEQTAKLAVDRLFEAPSETLTIEFQGGEPLLAFDRIRTLIDEIEARNLTHKRTLKFVVASTSHFLTEEMLQYFKSHHVHLSTSLDGPEWLHNMNRPNREKDGFRRTIEGIQHGREVLGEDAVDCVITAARSSLSPKASLTTLTRESLNYPEAIIDTYVEQGFHSIFLRPVSPYGFAVRTEQAIGYTIENFLGFYERALAYLLQLNARGTTIDEVYTTLLLTQILTPFPTQYVDLRSPVGAGLGVLVYNYDGLVYASDESRMLAEMGDRRLCLGTVGTPYKTLLQSEAMQWLLAAVSPRVYPDALTAPFCRIVALIPCMHSPNREIRSGIGRPVNSAGSI